jgi:hypothetical protein
MKMQISEHYFVNEIVGDAYNHISYEGAKALFEHLENLEDDCGITVEFDRVAIRCEYTEYKNFEEILDEYDNIKTLEDLHASTFVIEIPDTDRLIIQQF